MSAKIGILGELASIIAEKERRAEEFTPFGAQVTQIEPIYTAKSFGVSNIPNS